MRIARLPAIIAVPATLLGLGACGPGDGAMDHQGQEMRFRLQPLSAVIEQTQGDKPWDEDNSPPDVRVVLTCPDGDTATSSVVEGFTPSWNDIGCSTRGEDLLRRGFSFHVEDVDGNSAEPITEEIHIYPRAVEMRDGRLDLGAWYGLENVSFKFIRISPPRG